jgi:large subunit ribosomal protein L30
MADQIQIKLVKSLIGKPTKQRAVLGGLGLNKVNKTVTLLDTPEVRGMVHKVAHLVQITE